MYLVLMIRLALASLASLASLVILGTPIAALAQDDVDSAAWLSGCWVASAGDVRSEEVWMKPDGGLMVGMARSVRAAWRGDGVRVSSAATKERAPHILGLSLRAGPDGFPGHRGVDAEAALREPTARLPAGNRIRTDFTRLTHR